MKHFFKEIMEQIEFDYTLETKTNKKGEEQTKVNQKQRNGFNDRLKLALIKDMQEENDRINETLKPIDQFDLVKGISKDGIALAFPNYDIEDGQPAHLKLTFATDIYTDIVDMVEQREKKEREKLEKAEKEKAKKTPPSES